MDIDSYKREFGKAVGLSEKKTSGMLLIMKGIGLVIGRLLESDENATMIMALDTASSSKPDPLSDVIVGTVIRQIQVMKVAPKDGNEGGASRYVLAVQLHDGDTITLDIPFEAGEAPDEDAAVVSVGDSKGYLIYPQSVPCAEFHEGDACSRCAGTGRIRSLYAGAEFAQAMNQFVDKMGLPDDPDKTPAKE